MLEQSIEDEQTNRATTENLEISFRPHHFLCTLSYQGKGYSQDFEKNYTAIATLLRSDQGDNIAIQIVKQTDSICSPCPHRILTQCTEQEKISRLDEAHAQALSLENENEITWGDAKKRIAEKMTLEKFHQICEPCKWKKYNICENTLREFLKKP